MNTVQTAVQHLEAARLHMWIETIAIIVVPLVGTLMLHWTHKRRQRKAAARS